MGCWSGFSRLVKTAGRLGAGPRKAHHLLAAAAAVVTLLPLTACGGNPPQIVDYSPQRGAIDVSTAAPIKIVFDHPVDQASVESRLHLVPATDGAVHWQSAQHLTYEHSTLRTSTSYDVVLEAGYRDLAGNTYSLRHHWSFMTEGPPDLASSTPSDADTGIDPAAYISLAFTREMNANTLASALTFSPSIPFDVRLDPADARRAIVAPSQLLAPNTAYEVSVNTAAVDVDGNQLGRDQTIRFTTGSPQTLKGWVAFATDGLGGVPGGLWIVNESGFPRRLFDQGPVQSFSWSPGGKSLLIQGDGESWSILAPGAGAIQLPFKGTWAAALADRVGYAYIDDAGVLHRQTVDGADQVIATDVAQATVSPSGLRLAFVQGALAPDKIWGYDVELNARYQLALDTGPVSAVTWAPSGNRIAYLISDGDTTRLRVRSFTGAGTTTTVASGDISAPAWLPDSTHLVIAATPPSADSSNHRAFVLNVVAPPAVLSAVAGLPSDPAVDLSAPVPSPDGHQIAFLSGHQVWLMNGDGTRPTPLTKFDPVAFPYSCRALAWTAA